MNVLVFPRDHARHNPFLGIISGALRDEGACIHAWSDRHQLGIAPDIVFVNWAESHWVRKFSLQEAVFRARFLGDLRSFRSIGARVVWVAHNFAPHTWRGSVTDWKVRTGELFSLVDGVVHLSVASKAHPAFEHLGHLPFAVVPHPHYSLVDSSEHALRAGKLDRLLFLGGLDPRKQASRFIEIALASVDVLVTGGNRKFGVGRARLVPPLESRGVLNVLDRYIPESELHELVDGRTALALSQIDQLNSGALFFALSRGAPVLCPKTPTTELYRECFGPDWVRTYDAPITPDSLATLLKVDVPSGLPDLSCHCPRALGRALLSFFKSLLIT